MPLSLNDWIADIPPAYGAIREQALGIKLAMSDATRGFPLLASMDFLPVDGSVYRARILGTTAGKATRARNVAFATDAAPGTAPYDFPLIACGGDMTLDRNDLVSSQGPRIRAALLAGKARDIGGRLFKLFFGGDKANADEFQGINKYCLDNARAMELADVGRAVTARDMEMGLANVPGCNLILANPDLTYDIDNLLDAKFRRVIELAEGPVPPGSYGYSYRGVPIMKVNQYAQVADGTYAPILPFTEVPTTPGANGVNGVCSRITFLRLGDDGVHGAQSKLFEIDNPMTLREGEINHMNWPAAMFTTDDKFAVYQLTSVKRAN